MSAVNDKHLLVKHWEKRLIELLQTRNNLDQADLIYVVEKVASLKDTRLKACIAELVGWGDDERADMETFASIALETMRLAKPSLIRQASMNVEIRFRIKESSKTLLEE